VERGGGEKGGFSAPSIPCRKEKRERRGERPLLFLPRWREKEGKNKPRKIPHPKEKRGGKDERKRYSSFHFPSYRPKKGRGEEGEKRCFFTHFLGEENEF